jgi:hypothetical protein
VPFTVELKASSTRLQTWLLKKEKEQSGAYYVEVKFIQ